MTEPVVPLEITGKELPGEIKSELRTLPEGLASFVAKHLVAASQFLEDDPELSHRHALAAKTGSATRIAAVREVVGVTAYGVGNWALALSELQAAKRISGQIQLLPLIADCYRALGKPEKSIEILESKEASKLSVEEYCELLLVAAGARQDQGNIDAAMSLLKNKIMISGDPAFSAARLRFFYAELAFINGDTKTASEWFNRCLELDASDELGAAEMLKRIKNV
ncbi:MAG: tetratricopeptide repeat protein [Candidatus Nanopelagicales bacterium]